MTIDDAVAAAEERLRAAGEPFVRATVVRREPPISATVGDRAIVTDEGIQAGWVGGVGCAETAVLRESRAVLETGEPKLIGLAPDPEDVARPGLEAFPLTCEGGGTLEVFLEPVGMARGLLVVGASAIGEAVARGAGDLGFHVTVVDPAGGAHPDADAVIERADVRAIVEAAAGVSAVVVSSVGELDARGVAAALELDADYVGLVASAERAADVFARAAELRGETADAVADRVQSPAGIDVGAETPAEIAVSILAELVRVGETLSPGRPTAATDDPTGLVVDPVCGMEIDPRDAAATVDYEGHTYHFCAEGCADTFRELPEEHLTDA